MESRRVWPFADFIAILMIIEIFFVGPAAKLPGMAFLVLAPSLASLSLLAAMLRRKRVQATSILGRELVSVRYADQVLLIASYLVASLSWLNVVASDPSILYSTIISGVIACFYAIMTFMLLRILWLDSKGVKELRLQALTVIYVWIWTLVSLGIIPAGFACGYAYDYYSSQASGLRQLPLRFDTPPQVALLWTALCSLLSVAALLRTKEMRAFGRKGLVVVVGISAPVLAFSGVLEYLSRRNWYLYTLSSVSFIGIIVGVWRMWLWLRPAPDVLVAQADAHLPAVGQTG